MCVCNDAKNMTSLKTVSWKTQNMEDTRLSTDANTLSCWQSSSLKMFEGTLPCANTTTGDIINANKLRAPNVETLQFSLLWDWGGTRLISARASAKYNILELAEHVYSSLSSYRLAPSVCGCKKKNLITEMSTVGIFVCINTSQCCHAHMHHKSIFVAEIQFTTRKTLFLLIEQTAHGAVTQGRYHSL